MPCSWLLLALLGTVLLLSAAVQAGDKKGPTALELALSATEPLAPGAGGGLPLFLWTPNFPADADDAELERVCRALSARGLAILHRWDRDYERTAALNIRIAKVQRKLGMAVAVDATKVAHGFFDGRAELGHVDREGRRFFDTSFAWKPGCPFALAGRYAEQKAGLEAHLTRYADAGVGLDWWMADFEFDGPEEWNDGWATAKRCVVCREKVPNIDTDFAAFQKAVRDIRSQMQNEVFCKTVRRFFPQARIGNYGMNPHDGFRYWYDYFEQIRPDLPHRRDDKALYRPWADEFAAAGYNLAMPVIYTRYFIHDAYSFSNRQYRWFYNMLLEVTSVGRTTPADVPIIGFVHWATTDAPGKLPAGFEPMSEANYEELLWHALLRGFDGFAMWSPAAQTASEVKPVHRVYAASLAYREFLDKGAPVLFDVPAQPGPVVSALRLGRRLLVRRTDFTDAPDPVQIVVEGKTVQVKRRAGQCAVLDLPD